MGRQSVIPISSRFGLYFIIYSFYSSEKRLMRLNVQRVRYCHISPRQELIFDTLPNRSSNIDIGTFCQTNQRQIKSCFSYVAQNISLLWLYLKFITRVPCFYFKLTVKLTVSNNDTRYISFGYIVSLHADFSEREHANAVNRVPKRGKLFPGCCLYTEEKWGATLYRNSKPRLKQEKMQRCTAHSPSEQG